MDELIAALEREAAERAETILADGRAEAARIREDAEREALEEKSRLLERGQAAWRTAAAHRRADARREATRSVLVARAELLERVFRSAEAGLEAAAGSPVYREALPRHLAAALRFFEGESAVVECGPDLAAAVRVALSGRSDVAVREDPAAPPGFVVHSPDGRITVEEKLADRLARRRNALAIEVLARLESER